MSAMITHPESMNANGLTLQSTAAKKLLFLDGLRGLAAVYVMIGHARWLLWEGYSEGYVQHPEKYSSLNKFMMYSFSLFKYGHEAVLFFFVLSGFVIHLKYAKSLNVHGSAKFNWPDYLYRRIKRIYPPFIFALLLTALLDSIGRKLNYTIYYGATTYPLINENIGKSDFGIKSFLGNLFFLYKTYTPVFGTNGPAWSLKYEWWFYMFYPLFLIVGARKIIYPVVLLTLLFAASFFPAYWPEKLSADIFSLMITWWLGVILADVYTGRIKLNFKYLAIAAAVIGIKPLIGFQNVLSDVCMALFFFGLIAFFITLQQDNLLIRCLEKLKVIGDFSYTLYITHFPIMVIFSGWLMKNNNNQLPVGFGYMLAGIAITLIVAYGIHYITEVPFVKGKRIRQATVPVELQKMENA